MKRMLAWWTFQIFFIFSARGSPRCREGRGGGTIFYRKSQEGGVLPGGWVGRARGREGVCGDFGGGGGLNIFFLRARNSHQVRNPNHHFLKKYCNTPPIYIAVLSAPLSSEEREELSVLLSFVSQYASHLYRITPPTYIAVHLWELLVVGFTGWSPDVTVHAQSTGVQGIIIYPASPPFWSESTAEGDGGVYFKVLGQEFYTAPPSCIQPPPLEVYFQGWARWGCIISGPTLPSTSVSAFPEKGAQKVGRTSKCWRGWGYGSKFWVGWAFSFPLFASSFPFVRAKITLNRVIYMTYHQIFNITSETTFWNHLICNSEWRHYIKIFSGIFSCSGSVPFRSGIVRPLFEDRNMHLRSNDLWESRLQIPNSEPRNFTKHIFGEAMM